MTDNPILHHYCTHRTTQLLVKSILHNKKKQNYIPPLIGSLKAIIPATTGLLTKKHQVIIAKNPQEANYIYTDIQNLLPHTPVFLFPSTKPSSNIQTYTAAQLNQIATIWHLTYKSSLPAYIVTYPEAWNSIVLSRETILQNTITCDINTAIHSEKFIQTLLDNDFTQKDFANQPGTFAVRNHIIDIFDYANPSPIRIQQAENYIEKIKILQRSSQNTIKAVKKIQLLITYNPEKKKNNGHFLWQHCTKDMCWIWHYTTTTAIESNEKILHNSTEASHLRKKIIEQLASYIYITDTDLQTNKAIYHQAVPQPIFHQNFDLWTNHWRDNQKKGIYNLVTATSTYQIERLQKIFHAAEKNTLFQTLHLSLSAGFIDSTAGITCYTDHQIFDKHYQPLTPQTIKKKIAKKNHQLQIGDYVVHQDYGIGRFTGLTQTNIQGQPQEAMRLVYKNNDLILVGMQTLHKITKYHTQEDITPKVDTIGSPAWENKKKKAKKKITDVATQLISLYSQRRNIKGFSFAPDTVAQTALESSFMYEDTPDQTKATAEVKQDMEKSYPMDRLICGDVGFGKTEIAMRAAFKAIQNGKQVALLAPTTVLTSQHYRSFQKRFTQYPITIAYINRFKTAKEIKDIQAKVKKNEIQLLIGTHSILNKAVQFHDLGLLIVDEEQKFGVQAKEKLKDFKLNVDVLTLTATPIPRTLHFSLMGARDMSIINTPPPNRQPVITQVQILNPEKIQKAITNELNRQGQVFFVHNRIHDLQDIADMLKTILPQARMAIAHGKIPGIMLEKIMLAFIQGDLDILLSTNIIESGLDIPNANTILINNAQTFGLSDLHQMRGRVGRSNQQGFCYLLSPPMHTLTTDAKKRLKILEEFSNLGDGFQVAMRDLDIRGAGNLLGREQSGFINDLGFETYHQILNETVADLKQNQFQTLFQEETENATNIQTTVETEEEIYISKNYISNTEERLRVYTWMHTIQVVDEIKNLQVELEDKFGKIPVRLMDYLEVIRLRCFANQLQMRKVRLRNQTMQIFLSKDIAQKNHPCITQIILYTQQHPEKCRIQEHSSSLIFTVKNIANINQAKTVLQAIAKHIPNSCNE